MDISKFYTENKDNFLNDLTNYLKIQSISTDDSYKEEINSAVTWLRSKLEDFNFENIEELVEGEGNPIIYADKIFDPTLPTLLVYGHYDVQPPGELSDWDTPPFEPSIRENAIFARGATDNKGQFLTNLYALKYYLEHEKDHKWNIKIIVEGEEETGGETIETLVKNEKYKKYFEADYAYISDGPWAKMDTPSIEFALRGLVYFDLEMRTSKADMHSGLYGNVALNAANLAGYVVHKMKNVLSNNIRVPNIYKQVRKIADEEIELIDKGSNSWEEIMEHSGSMVTTPVRKKKKEYSPAVWTGMKPSLDVHGIQTGFVERGQAKTVVPATSFVKFSIRLVPDMTVEETQLIVRKYLKKIIPKGVEWTLTPLHSGPAYITDPKDEIMKKLIAAYKDGYGKEPALVPSGGSIGLVSTLYEELGIKSLLASLGLPDDRLHGPNEKYNLSQIEGGMKTLISFVTK